MFHCLNNKKHASIYIVYFQGNMITDVCCLDVLEVIHLKVYILYVIEYV
jgi:hypothetical protein